MANPSKRKGTGWESVIVEYLHYLGFDRVERRALAGAEDRGDIAGIPGVVIEAKAVADYDLPKFLRETEAERLNAGGWLGVCWLKLRGKAHPASGVVLMSGEQFGQILVQLRRLGQL